MVPNTGFVVCFAEVGLDVHVTGGSLADAINEGEPYRGVSFGAIGGAGAVLSRFVRKLEIVACEDLGPEAIRRLEVEDFPVVVINDCHGGGDLYQDGITQFARA